jgi:hypothetical protein
VRGDRPTTGTLALTAKLGRRKAVRIGAAKVVLRKPGELRVAVRISKAARARLRRGALRATATLRLRDAAGQTATARAKVRLR